MTKDNDFQKEFRHIAKLLAKDEDMTIVVKDITILYGRNWVVIADTEKKAQIERDKLYEKYGKESFDD